MDILTAIYFGIGLTIGVERLSRVTREDDSSMVCMGIMLIIVLWPLYIIYKVWKKRKNK